MKKTLVCSLVGCSIFLLFIGLVSFIPVSNNAQKLDDPPFYLRVEARNPVYVPYDNGGGNVGATFKADLYICAYADYSCTTPYVVPEDFDFGYSEEHAYETSDPILYPSSYSNSNVALQFPGGVSEFKLDEGLPIGFEGAFPDFNMSEYYSIYPLIRCAPSSLKYIGVKSDLGTLPAYFVEANLPDCNCN